METEPRIEKVKGWGVDLEPSSRPGVPMEHEPRPEGEPHWTQPVRQRSDVPVLLAAGRKEPTPVFGTGEPPRGLSGLFRRLAYDVPEHETKHWLLLIVADRVDVVERLFVRFPVAVPALLLGGLLAGRLVRRAR